MTLCVYMSKMRWISGTGNIVMLTDRLFCLSVCRTYWPYNILGRN